MSNQHNKTNLLLSITSISLLILLIIQQGFIFTLTQYQPRQALAQNAATICLCASLFGPVEAGEEGESEPNRPIRRSSFNLTPEQEEKLIKDIFDFLAERLSRERLPKRLRQNFEKSAGQLSAFIRNTEHYLQDVDFLLGFDESLGIIIRDGDTGSIHRVITNIDDLETLFKNIGNYSPEVAKQFEDFRRLQLSKGRNFLTDIVEYNKAQRNLEEFFLEQLAKQKEAARRELRLLIMEGAFNPEEMLTNDPRMFGEFLMIEQARLEAVGKLLRTTGLNLTNLDNLMNNLGDIITESMKSPRSFEELLPVFNRINRDIPLVLTEENIRVISQAIEQLRVARAWLELESQIPLPVAEDVRTTGNAMDLFKQARDLQNKMKAQYEVLGNKGEILMRSVSQNKSLLRRMLTRNNFFLFCLPLIAAGAFISDPNLIDPTKKDVEAAKKAGTFSPND